MKIQDNFLTELFGWCFRKKDIVEICIKHLKYQYIVDEAYKFIWKSIKAHYETTNNIPTIGIVAQMNSTNLKVIETLNKNKANRIRRC